MIEVPVSRLSVGTRFRTAGTTPTTGTVLEVNPWSAVLEIDEAAIAMLDAPTLRGRVKMRVRSSFTVIPFPEESISLEEVARRLNGGGPILDVRVTRVR